MLDSQILIWDIAQQMEKKFLCFYCFTKLLRGTPNQNLACFVLLLKLINTFYLKMIYVSYSKLSKELKNGIEILVGQTVKMLFGSIT